MVPVLAVPGNPAGPGLFEAGLACFADGLTSSFVLVVRADVPDALVLGAPVLQRPLVDPSSRATCAIGLPVSRTSRTARRRQVDGALSANEREELPFMSSCGVAPAARLGARGTRDHTGRVVSETLQRVPTLTPAQIAQLPARRVVSIRRGMAPVIGKVATAWRRRDVRAMQRQERRYGAGGCVLGDLAGQHLPASGSARPTST